MLFLNDRRVHSIWKYRCCLLYTRVLVLCNLSAGFPLCETTRFGCVKNSYVVRPPVPQEVEPWNMAGIATLTQRQVFLVTSILLMMHAPYCCSLCLSICFGVLYKKCCRITTNYVTSDASMTLFIYYTYSTLDPRPKP
jgi:hypothetical protein